MLARDIDDRVESKAGSVAGLGLLPGRVVFADRKTLGRPEGQALGAPVTGYEIHHGRVDLDRSSCEPFLDGGRVGAVWGTSWHGTLENDAFRRAFLTAVAEQAGRDFVPAPDTNFARLREAGLDAVGDLVANHLDTAALSRLISGGPPSGLPGLPPAGPPAREEPDGSR
jgi:adenosylcobyric acid synthase